MCKENYSANRLIGHDVDVTAGIGQKETSFNLDKKDGEVIGISAAENYARVDLAKCLLTIEVTNDSTQKPLLNVPLTQLLPDGERQMWPLSRPFNAGAQITAKLTSRSANTVVATPITLIFHYRTPQVC